MVIPLAARLTALAAKQIPKSNKSLEALNKLRGQKAAETRKLKGIKSGPKVVSPVSWSYRRGEIGNRTVFNNRKTKERFEKLVKKWQRDLPYQNHPNTKLIKEYDDDFMKFGFTNFETMQKARGDVSHRLLNYKSFQGYPQTAKKTVGSKIQQRTAKEKEAGTPLIRAFAGDKEINLHHAAGIKTKYRAKDLSYSPASLQQDPILTGGAKRVGDAIEPMRDKNNALLTSLYKKYEKTKDPAKQAALIDEMNTINAKQDKILSEFGDLIVVKKYNPKKNIVEFVGEPKNSLDPGGKLFGDKLIQNFTLEDYVLLDMSRNMRRFDEAGNILYKARKGVDAPIKPSLASPETFNKLLDNSLNKFVINERTGRKYFLKDQAKRLGKVDPAEKLYNISKDWTKVREQIKNNVRNRFFDNMVSETGDMAVTRPGWGLNKGGRVGYAKGGRVGYAKGGGVDIGSLANIKDSSKVGTFQSVLAGIGSGLIDIPKGAFSLGAALIDMGLGTNHAAQVESFFDDLTTLDEKAEATTAGKITRIMTNLGVPGTAAFKMGSRLTKQAMAAKDKGTYFTITKNTAGELEKVLNTKGRMMTTLGGAAGVGASDAIFVGDAENVGTLGDAFNIGPTQLLENDENIASRTVMNRIKFGIDSAMLGGLIGGTGTAIGLAVKRSKNLKRNNDFIDRILDYTTPQGAKSREFFDLERGMTGQRSADLNRAQEIQRQLDKHVDGLYPFISRVSSFGVQKQREAVMKTINEALTSTVKGPRGLRVEGSVPTKEMLESGEEIIAPLFTLGDMSPEALAAVKKIKGINSDEVIKLLTHSRKIMDNSFTDIASNIYRNSAKTSEARANVLEKFAAFKKGFENKAVDYINDTWRIFGNKNVEALKGFKPTEEAVTNAKELFKQLAIKRTGKTMTDQEAAYQVDRLIESAKPQNKFLVEGSTVPLINDETGFLKDIAIKDWKHAQLPLNKVMGEITKDGVPLIGKDKLTPRKVIEDLFGKVDDASSTVLSSLNNLSIIRRKHEFYGNFYDQFFGKQLFNTRREAAQVFGEKNVGEKVISMNQTGHGGKLYIGDAVNPLDGKWTSKGIQDALEGTNKNLFSWTEDGNLFSTLYNNLILYPKATSQLAKTVLSPITHVRNLISAGAFAAANGIMPLVNKEALDEAFGAMRQVGARGNEAANKRYRELLRLGVVNRNARLGDLEDLLADVDFGSKFSQIRALRGVTKKLSKFKQTATDAYTAEDDFWKMFTFSAERQRIAKALNSAGIDRTAFAQSEKNDLGRAFGTFDEYLDEAAANVVRNNVPNYDYVSRFVKDLRRAPMGNFVSFPAEIIRTSINIVKKGLDEIQYVDPITGTKPFKNIGMQRLLGYGLTTVAVPYGTVEAFKAAYNVSGVEMDALRRFVPDWSKNSTLVPIKDDDGNFKYIDFSHANAYDTMIRPVQSILNAVADGRTDTDTVMEDFMQGVVTATSELGQPFISESIWTQALGDIFVRGGRTKDGKRLYTDQTPFGDRFWEASKHLVEAQTPLNLKQFGRLSQGITGSPDEYGRTYELPDEMLGFAGLRAVKVDPVTSMKFKIADFTRGQSEARAEFTKNLLKGGPVTAEEIVDRYKTANEAMFNVQKNLSQDYYGALVLGAGAKAINNEFADRVSRTQLNSIIRGNFQPFVPSENVEKAFSDNAKKLDLPNPYREAAATIKKMANMYKKMKLFSQVFPDIPNPFSGEDVSLPTAGMNFNNQVMNLGKTEQPLFGQSTNQNTLAKGQQVFGPNDTVFGA